MSPDGKILTGIGKPIICRKCGHKLGFIRLRPKIKWRTIRWAIGLGLLFEIVANIVVYLIFNANN